MTRAERQDRTRELLLEAAERIFTEQGFYETSVDQIAEAAGFSKGAVYSQFDNKDELFLCVLERRIDSKALAVEEGIDSSRPVAEQATAAGDAFLDVYKGDANWSILLMEYAVHAARHPEVRDRFAARNRHLRAESARMIEEHLDALGLKSKVPASELATIVFSLGRGIILEELADPAAVTDKTFGLALGLLFEGLTK